MAVVTLPLANPARVVENAAFVDILSGGRVVLGLGLGYRKDEFDGFGLDFEARRDMQDEALAIMLDLLRTGRVRGRAHTSRSTSPGDDELLPQSVQKPYALRALFLAGAIDRSIGTAGRMGFGSMLSTLTLLIRWQPRSRTTAPISRRRARRRAPIRVTGRVDVARWVYVAETDAKAKRDSEEGLLRRPGHFFFGGHQSGYLGQVSQGEGSVTSGLDYDTLARSTIIHGSPSTVAERIAELKAKTGLTSLMLHYRPGTAGRGAGVAGAVRGARRCCAFAAGRRAQTVQAQALTSNRARVTAIATSP